MAYADAIVTGCVPGSTFGNFRFNITYVDFVGRVRAWSAKSKSRRLSNQRGGDVCGPGRRVAAAGDRYTIAFHQGVFSSFRWELSKAAISNRMHRQPYDEPRVDFIRLANVARRRHEPAFQTHVENVPVRRLHGARVGPSTLL